jgi:hypothetical protein
MAIIINGIKCETIEQVEEQIISLSEEQKNIIRNDFNGVPNESITNPVPQTVTTRQMHKALAMTNKLSTIKAFIASLPEPNKTLIDIEFNQSNEFQRDNILLNQMAPQLGMTSADVDQLFIYASTL